MIKRLVLTLLIACLFAIPARTTTAQNSGWQIALFDTETATLYYVTEAGVETGPTFPQMMDSNYIAGVQLSPDGRWLAINVSTPSSEGLEQYDVYIADVANNTCCTQMIDPLNSGLTLRLMGPFSPDSSQIAIYMGRMMSSPDQPAPINLVSVFDIASGIPAAAIDVHNLDINAPAVMFGDWKGDGIRLAPSCWGCEPPIEGTYSIWAPESNKLVPSTERFDMLMDVLPATGEGIKAVQNLDYPESGLPGGILPPANVVEYYGTGPTLDPGQVIYANPTNHYIMDASWVADGSAVLVQLGGPIQYDPAGGSPMATTEGAEAYVLFRDGSMIPAPDPNGYIVTGTPDGWISVSDQVVSYHRLTEAGTIETTTLLDQVFPVVAGTNFVLGANAQGIFPVVLPPEPVTCPGFMPSRLVGNSVARVTPGDPNNIRTDPSTSSTQIGQIPGGELFIVLQGPTCADNLAWWQVNYNGTIGWTVEGQDQTYWLDPGMGDGY
jgi:hypothetical protein